ncbi:hypothetical protein FRC07_003553 [Ceratobasidium sp. 392]|nr:hypothetical protein FRC07_003553 [Ceratobasidium sp. 392]
MALAQLASLNPNIRELELSPAADGLCHLVLVESIPPMAFASLSKFQTLQSLVASPAILHYNALEMIAQLPKLASLQICNKGEYPPCRGFHLLHQLPSGSFPSLVTLDISLDSSQDTEKFWRLIPLGMLTKIYLGIQSAGRGTDILRLIASLCSGSPLVKELTLELDYPEDDTEFYSLHPDTIEHLGHLSMIRSFDITHARFDSDGFWGNVAKTWSSLREFDCINQNMRLKDLILLSASLPNLCKLECDFDLVDMVGTVEHGWEPVGRPTFYPGLKKLVIKPFKLKQLALSDRPYDLDDSARFFAYFWPNLCLKTALWLMYKANNDDIRSYELAMFRMFNKLIKSHARFFHNGV